MSSTTQTRSSQNANKVIDWCQMYLASLQQYHMPMMDLVATDLNYPYTFHAFNRLCENFKHLQHRTWATLNSQFLHCCLSLEMFLKTNQLSTAKQCIQKMKKPQIKNQISRDYWAIDHEGHLQAENLLRQSFYIVQTLKSSIQGQILCTRICKHKRLVLRAGFGVKLWGKEAMQCSLVCTGSIPAGKAECSSD